MRYRPSYDDEEEYAQNGAHGDDRDEAVVAVEAHETEGQVEHEDEEAGGGEDLAEVVAAAPGEEEFRGGASHERDVAHEASEGVQHDEEVHAPLAAASEGEFGELGVVAHAHSLAGIDQHDETQPGEVGGHEEDEKRAQIAAVHEHLRLVEDARANHGVEDEEDSDQETIRSGRTK